jgi:hypothetical protein
LSLLSQVSVRSATSFWGYSADPQIDRKEAVQLLRLALSDDDGDWIARGGPSNSTLLIEGVRKAGLPD